MSFVPLCVSAVTADSSSDGIGPGDRRLQAGAGDRLDQPSRAAAGDRVRSEHRSAAAARHDVSERSRRHRPSRRLLRQEARRAGVRLLRLPDAVHHGDQRPLQRPRRDVAERGHGLRDRDGELQPARYAGVGDGEESRVPRTIPAARGRRGMALPDGRPAANRSADEGCRLPLRLGRGDQAVRAPERRHRRHAGRTVGKVPVRHRVRTDETCASPSSKRRTARSARPRTRCCSTASTTTR